jgi:hypothetical protein
MKPIIAVAVCLVQLLSACQKKDTVPPVSETPVPKEVGKVAVDVSPAFGSEDLQYSKYYFNAAGDSVNVTRFAYYVSNVVFVKSDGSSFAEPESYHLLDHSGSAVKGFTVANVPIGDYTSLSFMIGVDSLRNCSGAQSGDLDPAKGMFWTWNSGYIFLKMEGRAPRSAGNKAYTYHIGGFKGVNRTMQNVGISFNGSTLKCAQGGLSRLSLKADAGEIFKSPNLIDVSTFYYQMSEGAGAKKLSENYKDMFTFKAVQNP